MKKNIKKASKPNKTSGYDNIIANVIKKMYWELKASLML